jgi:hypothetical protein
MSKHICGQKFEIEQTAEGENHHTARLGLLGAPWGASRSFRELLAVSFWHTAFFLTNICVEKNLRTFWVHAGIWKSQKYTKWSFAVRQNSNTKREDFVETLIFIIRIHGGDSNYDVNMLKYNIINDKFYRYISDVSTSSLSLIYASPQA